MTIKAVLFDLDETILDRSRSLELFLTWEASEYLNLSYADCERYIERFIELDDNGMGNKTEVYTTLWKEFGLYEHTAEDLTANYRDTFHRFACEKRHVDQAIAMLKSQGLKLGVVSNGPTPFQENNLDALGLTEFFDTVVVSEAVACRKPDASIFTLACDNIGVTAADCVFVGDNPEADIRGAGDTGMFTVFVPTRRYQACNFANKVCRDMRDLPAVIAEAANQTQPH
jgi:putative hydrolase of the HAD superfamily